MYGNLFIYTRLERFDYRLIYAPDRKSLPSPVRDSFIAFAREVVNTDNMNNGAIRSPRWALIKEGNHILIGLGCYNRELGAETSGSEKRLIRGFFGIYFDNPCLDALSELTDLNLYRQIYAQYIQPLWSLTKKDEDKTNSAIQDIDVECSSTDSITTQIQLNEQQNKCLTLSDDVAIEALFRSALMCDKVDIVCNLNTIEHVFYASLYSFHNVTIIDNKREQIIALLKEKEKLASYPSNSKSDFQKSKDKINEEINTQSSQKRNYQENLNNDEEYGKYVDILLRKFKCCKISVEKFLKVFAQKCGYILIPNKPNKNDKGNINSRNSVSIKKQADSLSNQQEELIESKEVEQFKSEQSKRRANVADLRRQYLEQTSINQEAHSVEELADIDNNFLQENESKDDDNEKCGTNSPSYTLKIEEL